MGILPDRFRDLGVYRSEVARGIVHTPEWHARMAALQKEFDDWIRSEGPQLRERLTHEGHRRRRRRWWRRDDDGDT